MEEGLEEIRGRVGEGWENGSQYICWSFVRGGEGRAMIPIQVLHSSCQESLPPSPGAPPDILPLLCSWPLVLEGRARIPIQGMHSLLPLAEDDLPLLLQHDPGLGLHLHQELWTGCLCPQLLPPHTPASPG